MSTRTTEEAFDEFDETLKLDPNERSAAEKLHNEITKLLLSVGLIVSAFLQGSFRRKTMIAPLRDVDKVVVLAETLHGKTPDEAMDEIQRVLAWNYPAAVFDRTRHSLKVDFGPTSFYFDIVPAWETPGVVDDDVLIANRDSGDWDRSNTRELIRVVAERNQGTDGQFIHQVRMAKQAIKHLLDGIIPGLHVESWAHQAITTPMPHDRAVARILATGVQLLGSDYYEPTGTDLISARLKPDVITKAKPVLDKAAADAREARRRTEAGQHEGAIKIWHAILGDEFPTPTTSDEAALRATFHGAGVTSQGRVSTRGRRTSRPTRSWRPS